MHSHTQRDRLIDIIQSPSCKKEVEFVNALKVIGPRAVEYVLTNIDSISAQQISEYGCANFEKLDFRPNPSDELISEHELLETLEKSWDLMEQTILVAIWMNFDDIRRSHNDATGAEAAFDTQLSYNDFLKYGRV